MAQSQQAVSNAAYRDHGAIALDPYGFSPSPEAICPASENPG